VGFWPLWGPGVPGAIAQPAAVSITADQVDYDNHNKILRANGNCRIVQGIAEVTASLCTYNQNNSQSILTGVATLTVGSNSFSSDQLVGNHRHEIFWLEGNVSHSPASDLKIEASSLIYQSTTNTAEFSGEVSFFHPSGFATAPIATVTTDTIILQGGLWHDQQPLGEENGDSPLDSPLNLPQDSPQDLPQSFERVEIDRATAKIQGL
jgi:lipopolysaccharide export system protein LptA